MKQQINNPFSIILVRGCFESGRHRFWLRAISCWKEGWYHFDVTSIGGLKLRTGPIRLLTHPVLLRCYYVVYGYGLAVCATFLLSRYVPTVSHTVAPPHPTPPCSVCRKKALLLDSVCSEEVPLKCSRPDGTQCLTISSSHTHCVDMYILVYTHIYTRVDDFPRLFSLERPHAPPLFRCRLRVQCSGSDGHCRRYV